MPVAVIGAGIVGVTTAFELASDGHQVTVFERRASVAEETSFANAGVVAPGRVVADQLAGRAPPIDVEGLAVAHLSRRSTPTAFPEPEQP